MTRLVVHMGARKTGTSYAQRVLGQNEARFSGSAYLPRSGRHTLFPTIVAHHNVDRELRGDRRYDPDAGGWSALAAELQRERPATALLTCENFEHSVLSYRDGPKMLERLRDCGDAITVVLTIRDWLDYANSLYCQSVKQLSPTTPFERYVTGMIERGETKYLDAFEAFLDASDVTFVLVDYREIQASDPLTPLLTAGGIEVPDDLEWPDRDVNVSLGPMGIEATRILSRYLQGRYPEFDRRVTPRLSGYVARASRRRGWNEQRFWGFDRDLAQRTLERVQPDLDSFASRVWGRPWPNSESWKRDRSVVCFDEFSPRDMNAVLWYVNKMDERYQDLRSTDG